MATFRVEVEPALLDWAVTRSRIDRDQLLAKKEFATSTCGSAREAADIQRVRRFAQATHAPFGMLFLPEPPVEKLPIPDFPRSRTAALESGP